MEILISEVTTMEGIKGYSITYINRNNKRTINDQDFFPNGSDIETKVGQLKKLLKDYFNSQA
jgi:hypothetical protein